MALVVENKTNQVGYRLVTSIFFSIYDQFLAKLHVSEPGTSVLQFDGEAISREHKVNTRVPSCVRRCVVFVPDILEELHQQRSVQILIVVLVRKRYRSPTARVYPQAALDE